MTFRLSRLAGILGGSLVVTALAVAFATYHEADDEIRDVLDEDLVGQSAMLAGIISAEEFAPAAPALTAVLQQAFPSDGEEALWVTVHDLDGGAPSSNFDVPAIMSRPGRHRLTRAIGMDRWRGYQYQQGRWVVQLLRRDELLTDAREDIIEAILTPSLFGGAVNLALLALLMLALLRPLTRLLRELDSRQGDVLTPITLTTPALEIAQLRDTLNQLFAAIDGILQRERRFASDVAHELRTPLTTLKLELGNEPPALPVIKHQVDRIGRVVEQLLVLARLEQGRWQERLAAIDVTALAHGILDGLARNLERAGIELERRLAPLTVRAEPTLCGILLQNLVDNVIAHCPAGTHLTVELYDAGAYWLLAVSDDGPGIPPTQRAHMTERFARLDRKGEGLGLGLAICHQIAAVHGAELVFMAAREAHGLRVEVRFPA